MDIVSIQVNATKGASRRLSDCSGVLLLFAMCREKRRRKFKYADRPSAWISEHPFVHSCMCGRFIQVCAERPVHSFSDRHHPVVWQWLKIVEQFRLSMLGKSVHNKFLFSRVLILLSEKPFSQWLASTKNMLAIERILWFFQIRIMNTFFGLKIIIIFHFRLLLWGTFKPMLGYDSMWPNCRDGWMGPVTVIASLFNWFN